MATFAGSSLGKQEMQLLEQLVNEIETQHKERSQKQPNQVKVSTQREAQGHDKLSASNQSKYVSKI